MAASSLKGMGVVAFTKTNVPTKHPQHTDIPQHEHAAQPQVFPVESLSRGLFAATDIALSQRDAMRNLSSEVGGQRKSEGTNRTCDNAHGTLVVVTVAVVVEEEVK